MGTGILEIPLGILRAPDRNIVIVLRYTGKVLNEIASDQKNMKLHKEK
jgi:hypothetical protein